ncbi:MAG: hypothetical protein EBT92_05740 [Planctomycetes bacterium]|nr:hypothetical protein [Planctomycetota bacterium]NBY03495.1 hypothetical protein [Planctomycetota bacterium]
MKNTLFAFFLLSWLFTLGCQSVSEKAASVQPLAENAPVPPYQDLLSRARNQSSVATESFFINNWAELEDAAKGLEQTSRLMSKSGDMPENKKEAILAASSDLNREAAKLKEACRTKNEAEVNTQLQKITLKIRELRIN